mgnify:FL=1
MDIKSILGYSNNSPYRNSPYLDIQTPEGLITMENTSIDLMGIDNLGNVKKMKAGRKKPYKFEGDIVREIPHNPYQMGGMSKSQLFNFIFDDEEEIPKKENIPTAPSVEEVEQQQPQTQRVDSDEELISAIMNEERGNPYKTSHQERTSVQGNPYVGEILSSGQFGNKNVGNYGKQIYGQLANDLGYKPVVNSIFRSKEQNEALRAKGLPAAKNSWHLTGNAIDLKPSDWHRLSDEKQKYYRTNYDVVYHNNHYHIEPK